MALVNRILHRLTSRLPLRVIKENDRPYLERYYVTTVAGVRLYAHRFVGSDPDRGLHDHPWSWAGSLVVSGRYIEQLETGERSVRWFNWLSGQTYHRVVLPPGTAEVWTLFFHRARNTKRWGFKNGPQGESHVDASGRNAREWWLNAPQARFCPDRLAAHTGRRR